MGHWCQGAKPDMLATGHGGSDGVDGDNGLNILNRTIDPVGNDGVDGEFYINTTTGTVWAKSGGTWLKVFL